VGARFSASVQTGPGAHPAFYTLGTGSFPGAKGSGFGVDHSPHLAPMLKKSRSIPLLPIWPFVACYRVKFAFVRSGEKNEKLRKKRKRGKEEKNRMKDSVRWIILSVWFLEFLFDDKFLSKNSPFLVP
jgi:hypothetical protein